MSTQRVASKRKNEEMKAIISLNDTPLKQSTSSSGSRDIMEDGTSTLGEQQEESKKGKEVYWSRMIEAAGIILDGSKDDDGTDRMSTFSREELEAVIPSTTTTTTGSLRRDDDDDDDAVIDELSPIVIQQTNENATSREERMRILHQVCHPALARMALANRPIVEVGAVNMEVDGSASSSAVADVNADATTKVTKRSYSAPPEDTITAGSNNNNNVVASYSPGASCESGSPRGESSQKKPRTDWKCDVCHVKTNPQDSKVCLACNNPRTKEEDGSPPSPPNNNKVVKSQWGAHMFGDPTNWKCEVCTAKNPQTMKACLACNFPRGGGSQGGQSTPPSQNDDKKSSGGNSGGSNNNNNNNGEEKKEDATSALLGSRGGGGGGTKFQFGTDGTATSTSALLPSTYGTDGGESGGGGGTAGCIQFGTAFITEAGSTTSGVPKFTFGVSSQVPTTASATSSGGSGGGGAPVGGSDADAKQDTTPAGSTTVGVVPKFTFGVSSLEPTTTFPTTTASSGGSGGGAGDEGLSEAGDAKKEPPTSSSSSSLPQKTKP